MNIESLILHNIRNYRGYNIIHFSKDKKKKKNITLIGGLNGAGKTTALESIKLCLYGKRYNGNILTKKEYFKLIDDLFNKKARKNNENECFISLKIYFDDVYPSFFIDVTRKWEINGNSKPNEKFLIKINDKPLEFIPKEYWQDYIDHLLPHSITEFFFFNGEKVRELAVGKNADQILKSSIKDLIGLNIYENLTQDLNRLTSKIRRRNEKKGDVKKLLNELEKSKKDKISEQNKIKWEIKKNNKKVKENRVKIGELQTELKRKAGSYAEKKKDTEKQILSLKNNKDKITEDITEISKNKLPFTIPKMLSNQLMKEIQKEQDQKNSVIINEIWEKEKTEFFEKLEQKSSILKTISKNKKTRLLKDINETFVDISNKNKNPKQKFLHDLTRNEYEILKKHLTQSNEIISKKFKEMLLKRQNASAQIKKLRLKLKEIPDDTFVVSYLDQIGTLKGENQTLQNENEVFSKNIKTMELEIEKIEEEINKTEEKIVCIDEDEDKINLIDNIKKSLHEYSEEMITLNTRNLEHTISHMYQNLANKDDMVKEIKLDSETFTTKLLDYEGNTVSKEWISEGEKEIYAISVLWGLSQISHHQMPMIIDTPLSKLDNKHVHNITTKFFPKASDQVVLFAQDREIDKEIYQLLKPNIGQEYTLQHSQEQKILDSYFFN